MGKFLEGMGVFGVLLAGLFGLLGYQEYLVHSTSQAEPQRITAAELGAKGPGDNIHVVVTDFEVGQNYVVEEKNGRWNMVWAPLFAPGKDGDVSELRVLLRAAGPDNEDELAELLSQGEVQGLITNNLVLWNQTPGQEFTDVYPGADYRKMWLVADVSRSADWVPMALGVGVVLSVLAAIAGLFAFLQRKMSGA